MFWPFSDDRRRYLAVAAATLRRFLRGAIVPPTHQTERLNMFRYEQRSKAIVAPFSVQGPTTSIRSFIHINIRTVRNPQTTAQTCISRSETPEMRRTRKDKLYSCWSFIRVVHFFIFFCFSLVVVVVVIMEFSCVLMCVCCVALSFSKITF